MNPPGLEQTIGQFETFVDLVILHGRDFLLGMLILVLGLVIAKAV